MNVDRHIAKAKLFSSAVMAGFCIGFGALVYLNVDNKVIGSALFSLGLFTVLTFDFDLFTGKICYVLDRGSDAIIDMIIIWLGNLYGTGFIGLGMSYTRYNQALVQKAAEMCDIKLNDSPLSLFLLGINCNIFIYIAVENYKNNPHKQGKYMAIILAVMGFILIGSEHCVADMFYFIIADKIFAPGVFSTLLIITAGNTAGGIIFKNVHYRLKEQKGDR